MNYSASAIDRIGDINTGLQVDTGILLATAVLAQDASTNLFTVKGRIKIIALFAEITTAIGAQAVTMKYQFTSTSPVIAAADMSAASGSLSGAAVGLRATLPGTTVATATAITASAGISYPPATALIVGTSDGTGIISMLEVAAATATSGAVKASIFYVPMSDGAYVEALA